MPKNNKKEIKEKAKKILDDKKKKGYSEAIKDDSYAISSIASGISQLKNANKFFDEALSVRTPNNDRTRILKRATSDIQKIIKSVDNL